MNVDCNVSSSYFGEWRIQAMLLNRDSIGNIQGCLELSEGILTSPFDHTEIFMPMSPQMEPHGHENT